MVNVEFEDIETLFSYQLRAILEKTESEIAEVKAKVQAMSNELEMLGKEPSEDDMVVIDLAAQFTTSAIIIKYQIKIELLNRIFELN